MVDVVSYRRIDRHSLHLRNSFFFFLLFLLFNGNVSKGVCVSVCKFHYMTSPIPCMSLDFTDVLSRDFNRIAVNISYFHEGLFTNV
jgi:hypothetical protein